VQICKLDCVPENIRDKPLYVGDHIIRHYRRLGLASLLRDLGLPPQESYTITGGIGTLTMYADGREDWNPALTAKPTPPRPADPHEAEARRAICQACPSLVDFRCTASGCGCAGEGRPDVWSSRCPLGRWPYPTLEAQTVPASAQPEPVVEQVAPAPVQPAPAPSLPRRPS